MRTSSKDPSFDPWVTTRQRLEGLAEIANVINREDLSDLLKVEVIRTILVELDLLN